MRKPWKWYLPIVVLMSSSLVACSQNPVVERTQTAISVPPYTTATDQSTAFSEVPTVTVSQEQSPTAHLSGAQEQLGLYAIPASCDVTALVGPDKRRTFPAWWLEGDGMVAGTPLGAFFAGGNKVQWQLATPAHLDIVGERRDEEAPPLVVDGLNEFAAGTYSSGIYFSAPGCWHIRATAGTQSLDATIYVYPEVCWEEATQDHEATYQKQCLAPS